MTVAVDAISVEHLRKSFGSVRALEDVSLHVAPGEVLGLIGDNGAGKSTLMKILTGFHQPDSGRIVVNGEPVRMRSVTDARALGIEAVYQDLALIDTLPVYLNMHLNKELCYKPIPLLRRKAMRTQARGYLDRLGVNIPDVRNEVRFLSGGQRQAIAVARSVYTDAKILLLDEPLAAMGAKEAGLILKLVATLKERGDLAIILIAHNYHQVVDICDRVNLLQHGEITLDRRSSETSVSELLEIVAADYRVAGGAGRGDGGRGSGGAGRVPSGLRRSGQADAGVQDGVEDVDDDVGDHDERGGD